MTESPPEYDASPRPTQRWLPSPVTDFEESGEDVTDKAGRLWGARLLMGLLMVHASHGVIAAEIAVDSIAQEFQTRKQQLRQFTGHWRSTVESHQPSAYVMMKIDCHFAVKDDKRLYDARYTQGERNDLPDGLYRSGMSYDGRETRVLLPASNGRVWPGDERDKCISPDNFLALQGYPKEQYGVWIAEDKVSISCDVAVLLRGGRFKLDRSERVSGADCIRLTSNGDHLWLDPARGHAIRQREIRNSKGDLRYRFLFDDLAEFLPGLWLARRITTELHENSTMRSRERLELIEASVGEVADAEFAFEFDAGTTVVDTRDARPLGNGKLAVNVYNMPARPEDLDRVVAEAVERNAEAFRAKFGWRGMGWRWSMLVVNLVILLAIGGLLVMMRMRRDGKPHKS